MKRIKFWQGMVAALAVALTARAALISRPMVLPAASIGPSAGGGATIGVTNAPGSNPFKLAPYDPAGPTPLPIWLTATYLPSNNGTSNFVYGVNVTYDGTNWSTVPDIWVTNALAGSNVTVVSRTMLLLTNAAAISVDVLYTTQTNAVSIGQFNATVQQ